MSRVTRWLPHPVLSAVLVVCWLWLNNTLDPGHVALGALLGAGIPLFTRRFWPDTQRIGNPLGLAGFLAVVMWDIVVANVQVAAVVLGPRRRVRSGFVRVPLDLDDDFAITVFASTISLTPGTVSVELAPDRDALYVHYLSEDDPDALVHTVKARYERRIMEVFR
ncbi:MAG: Na+/H+ antiporter subunit E [Ectothiorhodospiraceae bacterium]|nr:Na+/H+ antiporter subunit E [Ectothiorhodospiraceae bacterium]